MTIAPGLARAGIAVILSATLAACVSGGEGGGMSGGGGTRVVRSPVEGSWIDAQGTGLSTLSGGVFSTVATDTGQKLADGSYVMNGQTSVQINGTSLIRQQPISFNCLLVSQSQLNCTSATGSQFVLTRRA